MPHHSQQRQVAAAPKLGRCMCMKQPPRKQQHQAGPPPLYHDLLKAVFGKDVKAVQRLLEHNCREDVEAALKQPAGPQAGLTPLQAAALLGDSTVLQLLLDAGASVDARSGSVSAMQRCVQQHCVQQRSVALTMRHYWWRWVGERSTALHLAALEGPYWWSRRLRSYLHRAPNTCVQLLLAHGATVDARDGRGLTPLEVALRGSRATAAARALCLAGANFLQPPSGKDGSGGEYAQATLLPLIARRSHDDSKLLADLVDLVIQRPAPQQWVKQQQSHQQPQRQPQHPKQQRRQQRWQPGQQQRQREQPCNGNNSSSSDEPRSWLSSLTQQQVEELVLVAAEEDSAGALPKLLPLVSPLPEALAAQLLEAVFDDWEWRRNRLDWEAVVAVLRSCGSLACFSQVDIEVLSSVMEDATGCGSGTFVRHVPRNPPAAAAVVHELLLVRPPPLTLRAQYNAMAWAVYACRAPVLEAQQHGSGQLSPGQQPLPDLAGMGVLTALLACSGTLPSWGLGTQERPLQLLYTHGDPSGWPAGCPFAWLATRPLYPLYRELRYPAKSPGCHPLHLLTVAELLMGEGYRPATFAHAYKSGNSELVQGYCPLIDEPAIAGSELGRFVRLTTEHPCWAPEIHSKFPHSFKLAVRTLMLAVHRAGSRPQTTTSSSTRLCDIPPELLHKIVDVAAWPLSSWL